MLGVFYCVIVSIYGGLLLIMWFGGAKKHFVFTNNAILRQKRGRKGLKRFKSLFNTSIYIR